MRRIKRKNMNLQKRLFDLDGCKFYPRVNIIGYFTKGDRVLVTKYPRKTKKAIFGTRSRRLKEHKRMLTLIASLHSYYYSKVLKSEVGELGAIGDKIEFKN